MSNIKESKDLVSIATHLTREEADELKSSLTETDIDYLAIGHAAVSRLNSQYYEIKVEVKNKRVAREILGKMRAKTFIENRKCPRCNTLQHTEVKKNLWEKIYYYGTTLVQCQKCKTKYSI